MIKQRRPNATDTTSDLRGRAEAQALPAPTVADTDAQKLLHELQVHQIELELQNAELREARAAAEVTLERYTDLYDFAPVGYFTLDRDGRVQQVNLAGAGLLGLSRSDIFGRRLGVFVAEESRLAWVDFLSRAYASRQKENGAVTFLTADRQRLDAHLDACVAASGETCLTAITDVTERTRLEATLRESERKYRQLHESIRDAFVCVDLSGRIVEYNHVYRELLGYSDEELVTLTYQDLTPERWHSPESAIVRDQVLVRGYSDLYEKEYRRQDGTVFPVELRTLLLRDDAGQPAMMWAIVRDITERKAAAETIQHLAFYDVLTGLPNRRLLLDRLQQALATTSRRARQGALLFVDLDNFKTLNDTLGHDQGDLLLQHVAQRLQACVRESDTVARIGGDEFVVMLEDLSNVSLQPATAAETVGGKILAAINRPDVLPGHAAVISASIGVTLFTNHHHTLGELLKQADLAMYQAKSAGRNTLRFFDPGMQAALEKRSALEGELRVALRDGQFVLHYQPQVDGEGRMAGVEALLRWQHPHRGLLLPAAFLPLAEETGLIRPLGRWVMEAACRQMVAWEHQPEAARLTLAVNISARQFRHPDFVAEVLAALDRTGADPRKLKLELTESLLLDDAAEAPAKMRALKARGVGFSLEGYGTGYSSLSYLKQLPLDELKIARSFVREVCTSAEDAALARVVLSLGQTLGIPVIAEGVETAAQEAFLTGQGCRAFQGYRFGQPVPTTALSLGTNDND